MTLGNKRMTNIQLPGGEVVQGIRTNKDLGYDGAPEAPFEPPVPLKPLRYNPGLKCDAALEAMRPERSPKHQAITAGDKRVPQPPQLPAMEAPMPGLVEGGPMPQMMPQPQYPQMPMMAPAQPYMAQPMYEAAYPTDLLSQIKMRNRRFQQSCAMEGMHPGMAPPAMMRGPVMAPPPQMMMMMQQPPQMTEDMMMMGGMQDELSMIEQDLNMTRRATRSTSHFTHMNLCPNLNLNRAGPLYLPKMWATSSYKSRCMSWRPCPTPPSDPPGGDR